MCKLSVNTGVLPCERSFSNANRAGKKRHVVTKLPLDLALNEGCVSFVPACIIISKRASIHSRLFEPQHRRCDVLIACWRRRPSCVLEADAPSDWMEDLVKWSVCCWIPKRKRCTKSVSVCSRMRFYMQISQICVAPVRTFKAELCMWLIKGLLLRLTGDSCRCLRMEGNIECISIYECQEIVAVGREGKEKKNADAFVKSLPCCLFTSQLKWLHPSRALEFPGQNHKGKKMLMN